MKFPVLSVPLFSFVATRKRGDVPLITEAWIKSRFIYRPRGRPKVAGNEVGNVFLCVCFSLRRRRKQNSILIALRERDHVYWFVKSTPFLYHSFDKTYMDLKVGSFFRSLFHCFNIYHIDVSLMDHCACVITRKSIFKCYFSPTCLFSSFAHFYFQKSLFLYLIYIFFYYTFIWSTFIRYTFI